MTDQLEQAMNTYWNQRRKRASVVNLRNWTQAAVLKCNALIDSLKGETNPLSIEILNREEGRKEAFESVYKATFCDDFDLRVFALEDDVHLSFASPSDLSKE